MPFRGFLKAAGLSAVFLCFCQRVDAKDEAVAIQLGQVGDSYSLQAEFTAPVTPRIAWEVLTDYDHLSRFVPNIKGRVCTRDGKDLLVYQIGEGGFLFFRASVKVHLAIHEEPIHSILFMDIDHKDFRKYAGSWHIYPDAGGVRVAYKLGAERGKSTPGFVTGDLLQKVSKDMLGQVRREMERRQILRTAAPEHKIPR